MAKPKNVESSKQYRSRIKVIRESWDKLGDRLELLEADGYMPFPIPGWGPWQERNEDGSYHYVFLVGRTEEIDGPQLAAPTLKLHEA